MDDGRARKKLKDVRWPPEPELGLWSDPLAKDDLKPLRRFEYEALGQSTPPHPLFLQQTPLTSLPLARAPRPPATAAPLRPLLASASLRATLARLSALPRHAREPSLRLLLGLPALPPSTTYQQSFDPFATASKPMPLVPSVSSRGRGGALGRGRGRGRGGRGGGGQGVERRPMALVESTAEERGEVEELVEGIRAVLEEARRARGEVRGE